LQPNPQPPLHHCPSMPPSLMVAWSASLAISIPPPPFHSPMTHLNNPSSLQQLQIWKLSTLLSTYLAINLNGLSPLQNLTRTSGCPFIYTGGPTRTPAHLWKRSGKNGHLGWTAASL
jgi:hypothetical protein